MLRASSLGLSHRVSNISALHTCRRLYGARKSASVVTSSSCRPRHASSSGSGNGRVPGTMISDADTGHRPSVSMMEDHLQPVQVQKPAPSPVMGQSPLEGNPPHQQQNLHVSYTQQHQRLMVLERLERVQESLEACQSFGTASTVQKDGQEEKAEEKDEGRRVPRSSPLGPNTVDVGEQVASKEEEIPPQRPKRQARVGPTRTQRMVIEEPPTYPAGRPWSPKPVVHAVVTGEQIMLLRNIANRVKKAHKQCMYQKRKRIEKEENMRKKEEKMRTRRTHRGPLDQVVSAGKPAAAAAKTTIENSPSSLEGDDLLIEDKEDAESMEELLPFEIAVHIREHLDIIGTTDSVDAAWESYTYLIDTISSSPIIYNRLQHIPFAHLHRLVRLFAQNRPRTHLQYLRLLSVITYTVHVGGKVKQYEWNALIDHVGAGRRKTTDGDVENALAMLESISAGQLPGTAEFGLDEIPLQTAFASDVYTMTILLSLAARAGDPALLKQISTLMTKSGVVPNRITHLSLLRYFTEKRDLPGLRRTLRKLREQGMELGLDGVNACIWGYGYVEKLEIVLTIYRVLRHNQFPETINESDPNNILHAISMLEEEAIFVGNKATPNEISYTTLIQVMAYHGQFRPAISIFFDMLSTENIEQGAPLHPSQDGGLIPEPYFPCVAVYRAIFLGFARHGKILSLVKDPDELDWTLRNLSELFDRFLQMPDGTVLTHSVLSIIVTAFVQTSGGDMDLVRRVWVALDKKFGIVIHKEHSQSRIARLRRSLFPDDKQPTQRSDKQRTKT